MVRKVFMNNHNMIWTRDGTSFYEWIDSDWRQRTWGIKSNHYRCTGSICWQNGATTKCNRELSKLEFLVLTGTPIEGLAEVFRVKCEARQEEDRAHRIAFRERQAALKIKHEHQNRLSKLIWEQMSPEIKAEMKVWDISWLSVDYKEGV